MLNLIVSPSVRGTCTFGKKLLPELSLAYWPQSLLNVHTTILKAMTDYLDT